MPLGLEQLPLHLLGQGIAVMVAMGRWVSGLPGAVSLAPAMPLSALLLISVGGLWLAIWQKRWRCIIPSKSGRRRGRWRPASST
jgi:competence protein ComEC